MECDCPIVDPILISGDKPDHWPDSGEKPDCQPNFGDKPNCQPDSGDKPNHQPNLGDTLKWSWTEWSLKIYI